MTGFSIYLSDPVPDHRFLRVEVKGEHPRLIRYQHKSPVQFEHTAWDGKGVVSVIDRDRPRIDLQADLGIGACVQGLLARVLCSRSQTAAGPRSGARS